MTKLRTVNLLFLALFVFVSTESQAARRIAARLHQIVAAAVPDQDHDGVPDSVDNCVTTPNSDQSDCNHNGVGDVCEISWADRDDDHDGVCNGVDSCVDEPNPDQSITACVMQALTVPRNPLAPPEPHRVVSGKTTTLKGIARHGGDQFMWDFGDGSASPWMNISDAYNLGMRHAYNGAAGQNFVATLSVRSSSDPSVVKTATYPVQIAQGSNLNVPSEVDVLRDVAVDEALWHLHVNQVRGTLDEGEPGYKQKYGSWADTPAGVCAAVDAFESAGHTPAGDYGVNPYVEDVRRGLNSILAGATEDVISTEPSGNPDVNGNGIGVYLSPTERTGENGTCAQALADSRSPAFQSLVGMNGGVYGRSYQEISQDTAEWFAWGLNDVDGSQGGWGPNANSDPGSLSETTSSMEVILALMSAEANMGATLPSFVRAQTDLFFDSTRHTAIDNDNGGWGLRTPSGTITPAQTAAGLTALEFLSVPRTDPRFSAGLGFLYRHWNDRSGCTNVNLGNAYAMHAIRQVMREAEPDILRINEFNFTTQAQADNSFDWYYTVTGQSQQGLANNLITRQDIDGSWMDTAGCTGMPDSIVVGIPATTAFNSIVLSDAISAAAVSQTPHAQICDCGSATVPVNNDLTLSGACSTHPDLNRTIVTYEWDFNYDAAAGFNTQASGQAVTKVGGYPAAGVYAVALRVTDDNPASLGGPHTSIDVCNVIITGSSNAPAVSITQSPNGSGGWFTSSPAIAHVVATDNGSGARALACKVDGAAVALINGTATSGDVAISTEGNHLVECSATDMSGSATGSATAHVKLDATKPVISGKAAPSPNVSGWNTGAVIVSFTCTDGGGSGIATNSVAGRTISSDGEAQSVTNSGSCVDNAGNVAIAATVAGINIDSAGPVANPVMTPESTNGWNRTNVVATWNWMDALSGLSSPCTASSTIVNEGVSTVNANCNDRAGNAGTASTTVKIDKTNPVIVFGGNATPYTIDQQVKITCSATDALSGVASTTCEDTVAYAYTFGVGPHTLTATATDYAGNTGSGSTTFVVSVSAKTICDLTTQFVKASAKYEEKPDQALKFASNSCEKLNDIITAPNANAKAGKLKAYQNNLSEAVNAEWLTQKQADTLLALAKAL